MHVDALAPFWHQASHSDGGALLGVPFVAKYIFLPTVHIYIKLFLYNMLSANLVFLLYFMYIYIYIIIYKHVHMDVL